jgi:hypothetical protein
MRFVSSTERANRFLLKGHVAMRHPWTIALALALALPVLHEADHRGTASTTPADARIATVLVTIKLDSDVTLPADVPPSSIKVQVGNDERTLDDNDKDGTWQAAFDYLLPGLYPVTIRVPEGVKIETDPSLPIELEIEAGKNVNREITVKSVTTIVP